MKLRQLTISVGMTPSPLLTRWMRYLPNSSTPADPLTLRPVDQVLDDPTFSFRKKCLKTLRKICGDQALLPNSLQIPLCYNPSDNALYSGGYADVWKGQHQGYGVAVKVLRVYSTSNFEKIKNVGLGCCAVFHVGELTLACVEVLQGSHDVENAAPSERAATIGSDDDRLQICDDVEVDGKWEYQRVHRGA